MMARRDLAIRPARRQVTFAWPVIAVVLVCAAVGLRWPRARYTPAPPPQPADAAMAFVEIPADARGFLWPRDFAHGHCDEWPRDVDMDAEVQQPPPPLPFREWPDDILENAE